MAEASSFFKKENIKKKVTLEEDVLNLIKKVLIQVFQMVASIRNGVFLEGQDDDLDVLDVNDLATGDLLGGLAVVANTVVWKGASIGKEDINKEKGNLVLCTGYVKRYLKFKRIWIKNYIVFVKNKCFFDDTTKYIGFYKNYYKKRWWIFTVVHKFYVNYCSGIGR